MRLRGLLVIEDGSRSRASSSLKLTEAGFVAPVRNAVRLTGEGAPLHEQWARVATESEIEAAVTRGYERFLPLNQEFLRICNDWQVRPGNVPNDHADADLRLGGHRPAPEPRRAHRPHHPPGRALRTRGSTPYPRRLRAALRHVDEGERDWFTSPRIDSYHTVWMQLHEDLLLALGRSREHEPQA